VLIECAEKRKTLGGEALGARLRMTLRCVDEWNIFYVGRRGGVIPILGAFHRRREWVLKILEGGGGVRFFLVCTW